MPYPLCFLVSYSLQTAMCNRWQQTDVQSFKPTAVTKGDLERISYALLVPSFPTENNSSAGAEMNSSNKSISFENDEKLKWNAFHEMTSSSKRDALNLDNAHCINKVSVQQILIDYFQYHLHNNMNFDKKHDDQKNISLNWSIVKFAMHFCDKSVGGHDLRSAIKAKPPESDLPHFITWKKAHDDAAKKISDITMLSILNIEGHIDEQKQKAKIQIKKAFTILCHFLRIK